MGEKIDIQYLGDFRTSARHQRSGQSLITDAPIDNNGRGEAFSPTDLIATGLGSCIMTIMAIALKKSGRELGDVNLSVEKEMSDGPRMISRLVVEISFNSKFSDKEKTLLERAAHTCPVHRSLSEGTDIDVRFNYLD